MQPRQLYHRNGKEGSDMGIRIIGTGYYVPPFIATNEDFTKIVDTSDEWIVTRTGIKQRHIVTDDTFVWQMGAKAAEMALADAGLSADDIDLVIGTTCTPDYLTPSLACLVANGIGAKKPACVELNSACAGFVYALDMAKRYLSDPEYQNVLIVSSEMLSKMTDYSDRSTCVLFGDGAGAAVLTKSDAPFFSELGSDPTGGHSLFARGVAPGMNPFRNAPFDPMADGFAETAPHKLHQDGREVYKFATRAMPGAVEAACRKAGIAPQELDWIFSHQANRRILETAAKNLKVPLDRFYINIEEYGNMSSACIPVCLAQAQRAGSLERGQKLCAVGFGGGLVYAAAVFEW